MILGIIVCNIVGSVISPLLANIALHGMEQVIEKLLPKEKPRLIRYADDLLVLHQQREVVDKCQKILSEWLKDMGLELKPSKTRIAHSLNEIEGIAGFNFLGFNIRQFPVGKTKSGKTSRGKLLGFKTIITPSKESVKRHTKKLSEVIRQSKAAKRKGLIIALRPIIRGWSNYFSAVCSKSTYSKLDHLLFSQLLAWAKRRHSNKSFGWITDKYWRKNEGWKFAPKIMRYR